ncbi:MAG: ATP-binding cassette domain-containing protein [Enterocloster sp.]
MKKTIQISGLSKSYDGKKVIENLSFSVAAGEVYGLLGANGVGKSTTIECILGTKKADSGTVRILGLDPWTERKQLFKQVGVQFQEANYPDKIKVKELCEETICLYRYPLAYKELLHKFGLADKENAFVNEVIWMLISRLFEQKNKGISQIKLINIIKQLK